MKAALVVVSPRRQPVPVLELLRRSPWPSLLALVPALLFLPVVLAPPLNQDVAAILQFSQRWLGGERLYTDLIDVNPPLIFVLNLIPAAIAAITPLSGVAALQSCLLAYGGYCWWLACRVRDRSAEGPVVRAFLDVLPALFLFTAGYDFGQREHLMAIAALPYALAAARRASGDVPRGRIAVGVIAGVAFALKPYFLGIPALVELAVLLGRRPAGEVLPGLATAIRRGLRDPLPWVMLAVWVSYLASLPLAFPAYLETVVLLVLGYYLGGLTIWQLLVTPSIGSIIALLLPLLVVTLRPRSISAPRGGVAHMLALAAVAAVVAAYVQHKGWSYDILPIQLFTLALGGVLVSGWVDSQQIAATLPKPHAVAGVLAGLFALYLMSNGPAPWRELAYPQDEVAGLTTMLKRTVAGRRVLVLSPDVYPVYPALNYAGVISTSRSMDIWLLRGAYPSCLPDDRHFREPWEMGRPELLFYRSVAEDFARSPPAGVLMNSVSGLPWCNGAFDFIAYFQRQKLFADVWSRYHLTAEWGRYRLYTPKG